MMSGTQKRQVVTGLREMGFQDSDIGAAIQAVGYKVQECAHWIMNNKPNSKQKLRPNMEVWVYSVDDEDWVPGHIVSITKQLVSVIFNGDDFRWLEKESDLFRTEDDKPEPLPNNRKQPFKDNDSDDNISITPPRPDEIDYYVTFTESVLGLELYSDEDGFNCIVGRCVSSIAKQKVTPGSHIVQVNDRWLANYRFEEIRDAVKQAARKPPLNVTFRIKKFLLSNNIKQQNKQITQPPQYNNNYNDQQNYNKNKFINKHQISSNPQNYGSMDEIEEKCERPHNQLNNDIDGEILPSITWQDAQNLKIKDQVDHRDDVGRFLLATILDKQYTKVKVHYEGWNPKWDSWCDLKKDLHRFAPPRSISRKANTRFKDLKIRDYVDINPLQRHQGWRVGQIRRMDKYSGQAQIVYKEDGQEFLYWAHLNNSIEIAPFMTKAAERIVVQHEQNKKEQQQQQQQQQYYSNNQQQYSQNNIKQSYNNNDNNNNIENSDNNQNISNKNINNNKDNVIADDDDDEDDNTADSEDIAIQQQKILEQEIQQQQQMGYGQQQSQQQPQINYGGYYQNYGANVPPPPPNKILPPQPQQQYNQYNQIPGPPNGDNNNLSNNKVNLKIVPNMQKKKKLPPLNKKDRFKKSKTGPLPNTMHSLNKNDPY